MRASDIRHLIASKYAAPTHSTFFEVADATGARHRGWADAITMSLWPSHGLHIEGFEIKVSKYDWQKELANPMKAERFAARCDRWWIVACEGVITDLNDVPAGWGYMLASEDKLAVVRTAVVNPEPLPLDRFFLASILRSADKVADAAITKIVEERVAAARKSDEDRIKTEVTRRLGRNTESARILETLTTRLQPNGWEWIDEPALVEAIVAVYKSGVSDTYGGLKSAIKACEEAAEKMRAVFKDLGMEQPPQAKKPIKRRRA